MDKLSIKFENVSKQYKLGSIGGGTLRGDLQSWIARKRGLDDPNTKLGTATTDNSHEKFWALKDISFDVKQGEIVGIIGHNGAGKSTLLKLLARVTSPTLGKISLNGRIASMLEVGTGFHPELTGRENVYMNGAILGMTKKEITAKFDSIVEFAEIEKFIDTPVKRYSSGMYVKLAFAVAAHLDSEIMVMDEVLAVGDMKFQQKCLGKMSDVSNEYGRTVLYVSHNMSTIRQLCKRCIVLDHGEMIYDGDVSTAIDIYSERNEKIQLKSVFKKDQMKEYYTRGIKMLSNEALDTTDCVYKSDDKIKCRINCSSEINAHDVRLRVEIMNNTSVFTGLAFSKPIGNISKGQEFNLTFELSADTICNGDYTANYVLYQSDELGNSNTIDLINSAFRFKVDNKPDADHILWKPSYGGYTEIKDIKVAIEE